MHIDRKDKWGTYTHLPGSPPRSAGSVILIVSSIIVICWLGWAAAAYAYRQQHCVYLLGHWLDIAGTTTPALMIGGQPIKLFCQ